MLDLVESLLLEGLACPEVEQSASTCINAVADSIHARSLTYIAGKVPMLASFIVEKLTLCGTKLYGLLVIILMKVHYVT